MPHSSFALSHVRDFLLNPVRVVGILVAGVGITTHASAEWSVPDSYATPAVEITLNTYSPELNRTYTADLNDDTDDDTAELQAAIDDVSGYSHNGIEGGIINLPKGRYNLIDVRLKSNVHLVFQNGCTIHAYTGDLAYNHVGEVFIFRLGKGEGIKNVSMRSHGARSKFVLDGRYNNVQAISFADVYNFHVKRFDVQDTQTTKAAIGLTWRQYAGNDIPENPDRIPTNGSIMYITVADAHYGYGAIQANAGRKIKFQDIESDGGVTLRLETDWKTMTFETYDDPNLTLGLFDITAKNISIENGQSAVKLWPHAIHNGNVTIDNIHSENSEYAIEIAGGSLHKFSPAEITQYSLTKGSYADVDITDVTAIYSDGPIITQKPHIIQYEYGTHDWCKVYKDGDWADALTYRGQESVTDLDTSISKLTPFRGTSIAPILIKGEEAGGGYPSYPIVSVLHSSVNKIGYPSGVTRVWREYYTATGASDFYSSDVNDADDIIDYSGCP